MKFLITNSVPLNGGDEALLRSLVLSLIKRWPDSHVAVLCKDLERCRERFPDLDLDSDLEFTKSEASRNSTIERYRAADIVLSAPGGFLHDHYPLEERLQGFELALRMSKPVIVVAQSVGPFWRQKSIRRVRQVLNRVSRICVRDEISSQYLTKCGVDSSKVLVTADLAFSWHRISPELFQPKLDGQSRLVGLSFRPWPLGDKKVLQQTIAKAEQLCRHLLSDGSRRILFLSTCQGIPGYVDDSQIAVEIRNRLPETLQLRCDIDRSHYGPVELIKALGRCDAFIGMRLHGCILAMLAGVPAMGLGYEDKTEQIFRQMGLEAYQMRFDNDAATWIKGSDRFLGDLASIRGHLAAALNERCESAEQNIDAIEEALPAAPRSGATAPELRWTHSVKGYGQPHLRLRQVAALVNELKPKRMLDVGCATGHLRMLCPEVEYRGLDFIPPSSPVDFPFRRCDFNRESLPIELNEYNVIVCSGILEYIEDREAFLASLKSGLTTGGHLVLTYFNMNHISRVVALMRGRSLPVHPDWRGFCSPRDIQKLIEKNGFQIVKAIPMNHALSGATSVGETVGKPLVLPKARWWSGLLAHQFLFVAEKVSVSEVRQIVNVINTPQAEVELCVNGQARSGNRA